MASADAEFKCVTMFQWTIENFSYWSTDIHGESILSPEFQWAGTSVNTVRLKFFPKGVSADESHFHVQIELGRLLPSVPVTCKVFFLDMINRVPLASMIAENKEITKDEPLLLPPGPTYEDVLHNKSSAFLLRDSLTLRCYIFRLDEVNEKVKFHYCALSTIEYREICYIWPVEYLRSLETDTEINLPLALNMFPQSFAYFRWILIIPGPSAPNSLVSFKVAHLDETEVFLGKIEMSLLNERNETVKFLEVNSTIRLPLSSNRVAILPIFLTRKELLHSNDCFLRVNIATSIPSISECIQKLYKYYAAI